MEDHWHPDQFHMIHHAKFECNYGIPAIPLDKWFGTYRDKLHNDTTYRGAAGDVSLAKATDGETKHTYLTGGLGPLFDCNSRCPLIPASKAHASFEFSYCLSFALVAYAALSRDARIPPRAVAAFVAVGPVVIGVLILTALGDRMSLRWPFQKEALSVLLLHLVVALMVAVVPVYHSVATLLSQSPTLTW